MDRSRQYYLAALVFGLLFHGTVMSFTLENTYDAYVHMFFAEHYASQWFETWNYKWYTGFTMTSYPPLVHQIIALLSKAIGLKGGFIVWGLVMVLLFVRGVYHFSQIWVDRLSASYAAMLAVVSSSFIEALHLFGQLPSLTGIALLLNACPELYRWIKEDERFRFFTGLTILASVTAAHHVSTIFGMVFFVLPVLGVAVLDRCIEEKGDIEQVRVKDFISKVWTLMPKALLLGFSVILLTAIIIFPYWYWSKTDPISQVSIPHGSRANFLSEGNLGLVFFLIPWGSMLFFLPGIFYRIFKKRNLFLGLSFALAFVLGTGGTTPIPKMLLGETAFNILTLDRFTFWASVIALPFFGSLIYSLIEGKLGAFIKSKYGSLLHKVIYIALFVFLLMGSGLIINIGNFRPLQPKKIDPKPIANFMSVDGHDEWRYLTLGFGDQVAWLAAHTDALSVDGNYHSARRLPEMTTRAVERLENAKYLGMEGLGALQQFLAVPEKYHLKYIFNNDKFYEPLLFFYGWTKLTALENKIEVWERKDILPLPSILPKKDIPSIQKKMWGTLPLLSLILAFLAHLFYRKRKTKDYLIPNYNTGGRYKYFIYIFWFVVMLLVLGLLVFKTMKKQNPHISPNNLLEKYYHHIDFKNFDAAFELLDGSEDLSKEQFLLELSLEDGLLASYAKLDSIEITPLFVSDPDEQVFQVTATWLTSVKTYETNKEYTLKRILGNWYIKKEAFEKKIPPDQFLRIAEVDFFNQGRRKATTSTTIREDILDRPEIYINEASLVERNGNYHIVGMITNVDNDPSYVSVDVELYDKDNNIIINYTASDAIIHNLMPKESTPFRIDFEDVFWQENKESFPDDFDPEGETSLNWDRKPVDFVINVRSSVTDERLYKSFGVEYKQVKRKIKGSVINYGNHEMAIPQILQVSRIDDRIKWVETHYLEKGIRPQRSKDFEFPFWKRTKVNWVKEGTDDKLLVNSVERNEMMTAIPVGERESDTSDDLELFINAWVNFK